MAEKAQVPATQATDQQKVITYTSADGQEIKLSIDTIRKFLVQGHGEMVTLQEMAYFMAICQSRKLNPFIKDCYLIKYSASDAAAIVTSVDYFRKRARAMPDCKGWKSGIIVKTADGNVRDTYGLLQDGETLLGGWFESRPEGWQDPFRLEVNLRGYLKKTNDGKITRFWAPENQPTMIQKVAESQGLRRLWPDEFQGIYSEDEITPEDRKQAVDIIGEEKPDLSAQVAEFDKATEGKASMGKYIEVAAKHFKKSADEIKTEALKDLPGFMAAYDKWMKAQEKKQQAEVAVSGQAPPEDRVSPCDCPNNPGNKYTEKYCAGCPERKGCPAWPAE